MEVKIKMEGGECGEWKELTVGLLKNLVVDAVRETLNRQEKLVLTGMEGLIEDKHLEVKMCILIDIGQSGETVCE